MPSVEKVVISPELTLKRLQEIGTFFTDESVDIRPMMLLNRSYIPDSNLADWDSRVKKLEDIDPTRQTLPRIVNTMKAKTTELMQKTPLTSGEVIKNIIEKGLIALPKQSKSETATPEMCELIGEALALVHMGHLSSEAFSAIIEPVYINEPEEYIIGVIDAVGAKNNLNALEAFSRLLISGNLQTLVADIQEQATSLAEKSDSNTDDVRFISDESDPLSFFLMKIRKHYPSERPSMQSWEKYVSEINQIIWKERVSRKGMSRELPSKPIFLTQTITLLNGSKRKLSFDAAYGYLMACKIFETELNSTK